MQRKRKYIALLLIFMTLILLLTGCASLQTYISELKGELFGNDYTISQYDDLGNLVFTIHGDRVAMDCEVDKEGEISSYIDIAIDGKSWNHVGSTLVFAQNGVDMITDFQLPDDMESNSGSTGLMAADRVINKYANRFGKKQVVVVSSQNGTPIALFQGNKCYVEIPDDLPKTTLINIDGKLVYIHRANVDILPASMFPED